MHFCRFIFFVLCWGLTSQSTIFQSCRDGATASWVINQYFRGVKCLAQGHNTAAVGFEPPTSRSGVRHSTTEPPRSPFLSNVLLYTGIILIHFYKQWRQAIQPSRHMSEYRAIGQSKLAACDKTNKLIVRTAKTQISLGILPVWSETSLALNG